MAGGEVQTDGRAERNTSHMCAFDADGAQERSDLVCITIGRVRSDRLVALTRAGQIDRDAAEVFGVSRKLERVASVVRRRIWDQQERLPLPLDVVVDRQAIDIHLWHSRNLLTTCGTTAPAHRGGRTSGSRTRIGSRWSDRSVAVQRSGRGLDLLHHFKPVRLPPMLDDPAT